MALMFPQDACNDVIIIGAGFSRALSASMPLTDELGNESVGAAGLGTGERVPIGGFTGGRFEEWLSRLAENQPDLSDLENASNRALFRLRAQSRATTGTRSCVSSGNRALERFVRPID
jgi:hypothetical protein